MASEMFGIPNNGLFSNANLLCGYEEFWKRKRLQKSSKKDRPEIFSLWEKNQGPAHRQTQDQGTASSGKMSLTVLSLHISLALDLWRLFAFHSFISEWKTFCFTNFLSLCVIAYWHFVADSFSRMWWTGLTTLDILSFRWSYLIKLLVDLLQ